MMGMGHIFTARAKLEQIERDNNLNLSAFPVSSVREMYPSIAIILPDSDAAEIAECAHDCNFNLSINNHYFMRWAASHNNLPLVQQLTKFGADPGACGGYATRHFALNGNLPALQWLHTRHLVSPHRTDAIIKAANNGHINILNFIESVTPATIPPIKALFVAARNGHLDVLDWLVARGIDVHAEDDLIMFHAMSHADIPVLEWVKNKDVNLKAFNDWGQFHASYSGNIAAFEWFEQNGITIKPDIIANVAAANGHPDLAAWAIKRGGKILPDSETTALKLCEKEDNPRLRALIMAQRETRHAALVTDAINEVLAPPSLTTRLLRTFKR